MSAPLGVPDKNAIRVVGAIIFPGAICQLALWTLIDRLLGSQLLHSWLLPPTVAAGVVNWACVALTGTLWAAFCNYLEQEHLDQRTKHQVALERSRSSGAVLTPEFERAVSVEYDAMWFYYRAMISKYENRHLSGLVTAFHWEWNIGWALIPAGIVCLLLPDVVGNAVGYSTAFHVQCLAGLAYATGFFMAHCVAPWTHIALADIRERMLKYDRISPFYGRPIEEGPHHAPTMSLTELLRTAQQSPDETAQQ